MKLYKTSKAPGIVCVIFGAIFIALGAIMLFNPDGEDLLLAAVLMFILAALMLVVGIVSIAAKTKTITLVDDKLVIERLKFEPKNSVYADETKKILTIPTNEIVDFQVQGQSKSSSFLAAFLGGAIGAAIAGNRNPDKLIVKTKDSQVVVFVPQVAGNKVKNAIKLNQEQEELEEKLDTLEPMKPLDEEE
ncbi:MAG: DUF308 domain-containing protein [Anaeroplasmataceae bacterium]|nr:DUF308 domain-containing protein [Anaeroplasmataceae bacterium]